MMSRRCPLLAQWVFLIGLTLPTNAPAQTLYDAGKGTLPGVQGWLYLTTPLFSSEAKESFSEGGTLLDTRTRIADKAGYFSNLPPLGTHPANPVLDPVAGFHLSFTVRVLSEEHASEDRAGFSVIVIASDLSAIELGFWAGEIWAQSGPEFHHAEGVALDTTDLVPRRFDLQFQRGQYALSANGTVLLTGPLRRYDSFGPPYAIPNFLFFGDDTSSASARTELKLIRVEPLPRVIVSQGPGANEVVVKVTAEAGREVVLETSTDLNHWSERGTQPNPDGTAEFHDTIVATDGAMLYRAKLR
jgi:hypothetical protein